MQLGGIRQRVYDLLGTVVFLVDLSSAVCPRASRHLLVRSEVIWSEQLRPICRTELKQARHRWAN